MAGNPIAMMFEGAGMVNRGLSAYSNAYTQRSAARINASIADAEAADARSRGASAAAKAGSRANRRTSTIRSQVAGRGFTTGVGTAADLEDASDFMGQLEAMTLRDNARREETGHILRGINQRAQAAVINPMNAAFGSMIGGANLSSFMPSS